MTDSISRVKMKAGMDLLFSALLRMLRMWYFPACSATFVLMHAGNYTLQINGNDKLNPAH